MRVLSGSQGRRLVLKIWDWHPDAPIYDLSLFIIRQVKRSWKISNYQSRYQALQRGELSSILRVAGFQAVKWLGPEETGYHQPIVIAQADGLRADDPLFAAG